jgi:hypothetical protein
LVTLSTITADSFQAAQKMACECLWKGNALLRAADQEPTEHQHTDGTTSRAFRLACEIESFCKMLEAGKDHIPLVNVYHLLVTNGPYEHDGLCCSTAHGIAWAFAHRLWLGIYNVLNIASLASEQGWYEGVPGSFALERKRLDVNWEATRDRLRGRKPIDAQHFTRLVQIESARAAKIYLDGPAQPRSGPPTRPQTSFTNEEATASVGDINITVNVPSPEVVVLASANVPPATNEAEAELRRPLFAVEHWSQLAIGIDGDWRYWALTPAPAAGETFKKADACELELPGERWKNLFELLAASPSGNCCGTATLIQELRYSPPTSSLQRDGRAWRGALVRDLTSDLPTQITPSLKLLKSTVRDLARDLRDQVDGPMGRGKAALRIDGDMVRSGFVVGFLVPDNAGHLFFRHQLS